ncbi:MAG: VPLPA-CTERM-specific exosortase XrtD [Pseudomonadota bacterium]
MSVSQMPVGKIGGGASSLSGMAGPLWFALAVITAVPVFWFGFISLGDAWSTPEYSHGPLIPILSAYLFLRDMRRVPPAAVAPKDRWPGVAIIIISLAIGVLGNLVRIPDINTYGFILWVGGIILLTFGFRRGILFWASVLHLVYMLPLPQSLYWHMNITLQLISSEIGVWFVRLMGIPVLLEGNVIDLGVYKLQVAEACSGLRYLFPILSFSYVFCMLYNGPVWHKIVILISAAPITILMNSFRIGVIGVLVDNYGIEHAEGFLHYFEGWVIFGACVGILFLLAILMQRLQRNPKPLPETLDIDFDGLGAQAARVFTLTPSRAMIVAALVTTAVAAVYVATPQAELKRADREPFGLFPTTFESFSGFTRPLEPSIEDVLKADDYIEASFMRAGDSAPVGFFSAYYHKLTEGGGIHSPEVCLPVGGWEMFDLRAVPLDLQAETGVPAFEVNRAIIQKGLERQIVYYWFELNGTRLTNDFHVKLVNIWQSLTIDRTSGALVRYTTPVMPGETIEQADARVRDLMIETFPTLPRFLPPAPAD